MRNYTKPSAEVVELAVKEPVSLIGETENRSFGFGSKKKSITLTKFAVSKVSKATVG